MTATSAEGWPIHPSGHTDGELLDPALRRGTDEGLIVGGLVTFGAAYVLGILGGAIDEAVGDCELRARR